MIAKQNWRALKDRNVNLDEAATQDSINFRSSEDKPVETIVECAREGSWVLICPV